MAILALAPRVRVAMLAFAPRVQVAMLAFAPRVQVAIQTGTQLRKCARRECPAIRTQTYSGPVSAVLT